MLKMVNIILCLRIAQTTLTPRRSKRERTILNRTIQTLQVIILTRMVSQIRTQTVQMKVNKVITVLRKALTRAISQNRSIHHLKREKQPSTHVLKRTVMVKMKELLKH